MTTLTSTLTILWPRHQKPEVFHDSNMERFVRECRAGQVLVYSYKVNEQTKVLRVFGHHVGQYTSGHWNPEDAGPGFEVAYFRPNQWDSVRAS